MRTHFSRVRRLLAITAMIAVVAALLGVSAIPAGASSTRAHSSHAATVLGSKYLFRGAPAKPRGWGTAHPPFIYNGAGTVGSIQSLTWTHWDSKVATGRGLAVGIKPSGGDYEKLVRAQLKAKNIGHCYRGGPRAYRVLMERQRVNPSGGHWTRWHPWLDVKSICR